MARYGINPQGALGISMPTLRAIAKQAGRDHTLAEQLWASGLHEARILASLVDVPRLVTEEQMESWVIDFDSVGCLRPGVRQPVRPHSVRLPKSKRMEQQGRRVRQARRFRPDGLAGYAR